MFHLTTGPRGRVSCSQLPACANLQPYQPSSSWLAPFPPEHLVLWRHFCQAGSLALSPVPSSYCSLDGRALPLGLPSPSAFSAFHIPTPHGVWPFPMAVSFPQTSARVTQTQSSFFLTQRILRDDKLVPVEATDPVLNLWRQPLRNRKLTHT